MKIVPFSFRILALNVAFVALAFAVEGNTAIQPAPREPRWITRHRGFVEIAKKGGIEVLFLGDSITDFWRSEDKQRGGKAIWNANFAPLRAANFGVSADRTQHVLWRIENGELDGLKPKVVVLMIGTNNASLKRDDVMPHNTAAEAVEGVTAVVKELRAKLPDSKILLLAIFPRGTKDDPIRARLKEINEELGKLDDGKFIHFLDIGSKFLEPDGTLTEEIMPDLLHPSEKGYEIWAAAIKEPLARLLK